MAAPVAALLIWFLAAVCFRSFSGNSLDLGIGNDIAFTAMLFRTHPYDGATLAFPREALLPLAIGITCLGVAHGLMRLSARQAADAAST